MWTLIRKTSGYYFLSLMPGISDADVELLLGFFYSLLHSILTHISEANTVQMWQVEYWTWCNFFKYLKSRCGE